MKRKQLTAIALAAVMAVGNGGVSYAAASAEGGMLYSGSPQTESGWQKGADGNWRYFDQNGNYKTGWFQDADSRWYYLNALGIMQTGWFYDTDGKWYYLNDQSGYGVYGAMLANSWYWLDGNKDGTQECYCLDRSGAMYAGTVTPDGYRVNENGAWVSDAGTVYTRKTAESRMSGGGSSSGGSSSSGGGSSSGGNSSSEDNVQGGTISVGKLADQFVKLGEVKELEVTAAASNQEPVSLEVLSKDETVASASVSGSIIRVNGLREGITELTVKASAKNCDPVTVTVIIAVVKADSPEAEKGEITISGVSASTVRAGETKTMELSAEASNGAKVELTAESDAPDVASVSLEGNKLTVKGVANGVAVVTVLASAEQCVSTTKSFAVRVNDAIEEENLFFGQENNRIVINAVDALSDTSYAFHKNGFGSSAEQDTYFEWQPAEDGRSIQLLTENGENPNADNEWNEETDSYSAPRLTYKVNVPASGEYYVSFYSNSPDSSSDAFHIGTSTEPDSYTWQFTTKDQITNGTDDFGTSDAERWYVCNMKPVSLKQGVNYIHVAARESGVVLRQLALSLQNPIFMENKWVEESKLVSGYLSIVVPEDDIELEYGDSEEISIKTRASNGEAVELTAVSGDAEAVEVSDDGHSSVVLEGLKAGSSTVTVTASADGYADVLGVFNVKVANEKVAEGDEQGPVDLMVAPATEMTDSLTLVWDKPENYDTVTGYAVYQDDELVGETEPGQTHYTAENLEADTSYEFKVAAVRTVNDGDKEQSEEEAFSAAIIGTTREQKEILDVTEAPYNADPTGTVVSTEAVQQAIDDCEEGGTVLIPEGAEILTGALDLKSDMTFQVDGKLQGTNNVEDYIITPEYRSHYSGMVNDDGMILTRYEGWEMYCYRSLLNAGYLNPENRREVTCENLTICGKGTIQGRGNSFGAEMRKLYNNKTRYPEYVSDGTGGRRLRGRLLGLIQCKNVHITDVTVKDPSCWTIHMIYCDTLTTHGINISSSGVDNGDGWDPDSSRNMMIFDTEFNTGDDCISVKSGKNIDGNIVNMPSKNIRVFDLEMTGGHGMTVGSEESGGVEGIYMRDCKINNTKYGLELKAQNKRGGYIKDVLVRDCELDMLLAHTVSYNADGTGASDLPVFQGITIKDSVIDGQTSRSGGEVKEPVQISGFFQEGHSDLEKEHYVRDVLFENVIIGNSTVPRKSVSLSRCKDLLFRDVSSYDGGEPEYLLDETVINFQVERLSSRFSSFVEAESMKEILEEGKESAFERIDDPEVSGGAYRKLSAEEGALQATYIGTGAEHIHVTCSDAGEADYQVLVNDEKLASWSSENKEDWYTKTIRVPGGLKQNDEIRLEVHGSIDANVKLDRLFVSGPTELNELADVSLPVGSTAKHRIGLYASNGSEVTLLEAVSSDEDIVSVEEGDAEENEILVTGLAEGKATVTVTAQAGDEKIETAFEVTVSTEPVNLALKKKAYAKSEESGHSADKMVDGDKEKDSRWTAVNDEYPQWAMVDLGAIYQVESINLWAYGSGRTYDYEILGATEMDEEKVEDAIEQGTFETLAEYTKQYMDGSSESLEAPSEVRYLLIHITKGSQGFANITELEVYGPEEQVSLASSSNATPSDATAVRDAAMDALNDFEADNDTDPEDILEAVEAEVADILPDAEVSWKESAKLVKATEEHEGKITGTILISYEGEDEEDAFVIEIPVRLSFEFSEEEIVVDEPIRNETLSQPVKENDPEMPKEPDGKGDTLLEANPEDEEIGDESTDDLKTEETDDPKGEESDEPQIEIPETGNEESSDQPEDDNLKDESFDQPENENPEGENSDQIKDEETEDPEDEEYGGSEVESQEPADNEEFEESESGNSEDSESVLSDDLTSENPNTL